MSRVLDMAQSAVRDTARRLLAGEGLDLDEWLAQHRANGTAYEKIALDLHTVTEGLISVSYRTIARWCAALPQNTERGAA